MEKRVLGVLGGRDLPASMFKLWATSAHILLAADSGADFVIEQGMRPTAIVGDMDSVSAETLDMGLHLYRIDDQNHTDCDKLLALAADLGHPSVTLIGLEGDRLDHLLGTLHSAARARVEVRLAVRDGIGHVLSPGSYRLSALPGRRISVIPLFRCEEVELRGVRWPLTGSTLRMGEFISLSNVADEPWVELSFSSGTLVVLQEVPLEELPIWPDGDSLAILRT